MPTAAKLAAAVFFAALAWFTSELVKPLLPDGTPLGMLSQINTVIGAGCGWFVMGPRAHEGVTSAIGVGLTTAAALVFWALLVNSGIEMIELSLMKRYDGPVNAVLGMFDLMIKYGEIIAVPRIIGTLIGGGIVGGWFTDRVARRWS